MATCLPVLQWGRIKATPACSPYHLRLFSESPPRTFFHLILHKLRGASGAQQQ